MKSDQRLNYITYKWEMLRWYDYAKPHDTIFLYKFILSFGISESNVETWIVNIVEWKW